MALIKCPECEREISDKAASCPHCGMPIWAETEANEPKREEYVAKKAPRKYAVVAIIAVVLIAIVIAVTSGGLDSGGGLDTDGKIALKDCETL